MPDRPARAPPGPYPRLPSKFWRSRSCHSRWPGAVVPQSCSIRALVMTFSDCLGYAHGRSIALLRLQGCGHREKPQGLPTRTGRCNAFRSTKRHSSAEPFPTGLSPRSGIRHRGARPERSSPGSKPCPGQGQHCGHAGDHRGPGAIQPGNHAKPEGQARCGLRLHQWHAVKSEAIGEGACTHSRHGVHHAVGHNLL